MHLLAVWAHPDDEAFGPVGTLCLARDHGFALAMITATRGEGGQASHVTLAPGQTLGDVREAELRCSAQAIGVDELHVWTYGDGKLADVPVTELTERITKVMHQWQPQIIVTFGSDGITGHPDHIAISRATTAAFHACHTQQGGPERLLCVTMPSDQQDEVEKHRMGDAPPPHPANIIVDVSQYAAVKQDALRCHASQRDDWEPLLTQTAWFTTDHFFQVHPPLEAGVVLLELL